MEQGFSPILSYKHFHFETQALQSYLYTFRLSLNSHAPPNFMMCFGRCPILPALSCHTYQGVMPIFGPRHLGFKSSLFHCVKGFMEATNRRSQNCREQGKRLDCKGSKTLWACRFFVGVLMCLNAKAWEFKRGYKASRCLYGGTKGV